MEMQNNRSSAKTGKSLEWFRLQENREVDVSRVELLPNLRGRISFRGRALGKVSVRMSPIESRLWASEGLTA
jgi:hypothetical protein